VAHLIRTDNTPTNCARGAITGSTVTYYGSDLLIFTAFGK